jgi:DNA-dependent RNA polymerase auxiliary subunit epsilon
MSETNSKDEQREVVDNKMNLIEFIKSVEQMKLEAIEMEKRWAELNCSMIF